MNSAVSIKTKKPKDVQTQFSWNGERGTSMATMRTDGITDAGPESGDSGCLLMIAERGTGEE